MKKILVVFALIAIAFYGYSQKGLTDKPIESKSLPSADLAVTNITLIEAKKDEQSLLHKVKVSVTIKNNGVSPSGSTLIRMMIQNQSPNMVAPQYKQPGSPWYELGDARAVSSIAAGKSFTEEYQFNEFKKVTKSNSFTMQVMVDAGKVLAEANENDNFSAPISVTPVIVPVELVAIPPTAKITSQLKKVDTLVYIIGKADFRLHVPDNVVDPGFFNTYIQDNPHGVTLKRLGVQNNHAISASLIAPLHLPVGSVIRKIEFHYIILPENYSRVPHLVLRSNFLNRNGEGSGINYPVTSYWLSSDRLSGITGYNVKASITPRGFNIPVSAGGTYYFEILAGDNGSTSTPTNSQWPHNGNMFIWGITVYYTLQ